MKYLETESQYKTIRKHSYDIGEAFGINNSNLTMYDPTANFRLYLKTLSADLFPILADCLTHIPAFSGPKNLLYGRTYIPGLL